MQLKQTLITTEVIT